MLALLGRWDLWLAVVSLLELVGLGLCRRQLIISRFLHDCLQVHLITIIFVGVVISELIIGVVRIVIRVLNHLWFGRHGLLLGRRTLFFTLVLAFLGVEI